MNQFVKSVETSEPAKMVAGVADISSIVIRIVNASLGRSRKAWYPGDPKQIYSKWDPSFVWIRCVRKQNQNAISKPLQPKMVKMYFQEALAGNDFS